MMLILILLLILFIIIISLNKKYTTSVSGLKAGFTSLADGTLALVIDYTNPPDFGGKDANWNDTFLYITKCQSSSDCGTTVAHPSLDQLTQDNLFKPVGVANLPSVYDPGKITVPNSPVTLTILMSDIPDMVIGNTYNIGLGIYNNKKSIYGKSSFPNIYGDFLYTPILYGDPMGPAQVSSLSAGIIRS